MFLFGESYTCLALLSDPVLGSEMVPELKREEKHGIYMFLLLESNTFLAPLSHPIFGSEMGPEPKREENHGIVFCLNTILYIPGTPLGSDVWLRNGSGAQTEGKS